MEIMLLKDVYKLGRAGDVKRVADGYGRNYLIPQGLATLASPGALKQTDRIRAAAEEERARLNKELTAVYDQLQGLQLNFPVKAGETGKLYGSVTPQMIVEVIQEGKGIEIDRAQIDAEPIRTLGLHTITVRLTVDLIPELKIVVHREELPPESAFEQAAPEPEEADAIGTFSDLQAELEAEEAEEIVQEREMETLGDGEDAAQGHEDATSEASEASADLISSEEEEEIEEAS